MREGWVLAQLGDVCNVIGGGTPSKRNTAFYEGDIPWATVRDMRNEVLSRTEFRISKDAIKCSSTNVIPAGNVVIATRVGLGKVCVLDQDTAINQDLRGVIPKSRKVDVRFLFRWFQSIADLIEAEGTGATVKGVKLPFVKSLPLPLPPLPEQKRIVAILDEAFAGIDTAIANTEKNLANARELFESYLNSVFTRKSDGWKNVTIGDIAQLKGGKRVPKGYKLQTEPTKHPYISVSDFNDTGGVVLEKIKFISEDVYQQISRYTISSKNLYISIAGTIGKSGIVPKTLEGANLTENACKLVLEKEISNQYLYFFTRTESFKEQARKNTRTAAQPKLALERLKTIRLRIPPFETQERLVEQFNDLWSQSQDLESIYQQKLTALAELKQSLLQKAFSGELTAGKI